MERKHTPGPWVASNTNDGWKISSASEPGYFATLTGACRGAHENAEANARLIAATLELAEELRKLVDTIDPDSSGEVESYFVKPLQDARAALKAAGLDE